MTSIIRFDYLLRRMVTEDLDPTQGHYKGYFADPAALATAWPVAAVGDYAVIGSTDTVWVWDSGTSAWVDTGSSASGFVVGPAVAVDSNFAGFNTSTGKLLKDSGYSAGSFATYAQGSAADTAYAAAVTNATDANTISTLVKRSAAGNFSAGTITANLTGNASGSSGSCTGNALTATTAANIAGGVLGSIPYQSTVATTLFVTPNTSLTKQFLTMTGDGAGHGAAPAFGAIAAGDVPTLDQDTTGSAVYWKASATTGKISLTGPTTARQGIVFPAQVPEPGLLALMAAGIGFLGWQRRRKAA
jgi:hypothetical protein